MRIYSLYRQLLRDNFSLFYLGEFDDDLTEVLMQIQETSSDEERSTKKRMNYLIAECFQNIIRHTKHEEDQHALDTSKFFMMRIIERTHFLATANPIQKANQQALSKSLDSLQNLSAEELKAIYLEALGSNKLSAKGGGGLGLIEMARKTSNPPSYHFDTINESYSNFFMQLKMKKGEGEDIALEVEDTVDLYREMLDENIVLLRKGDFSQEAILPLFKLFESNLQLKKEDLVFKKKSLYILIELLQNMNKHAVEIKGSKEGVFIVSFENSVYTMKTGNFIKMENGIKLKAHLDSLVGLDKDQLAKRYKQQLMTNSMSEDHGAGIGIIEMIRQSDGEILYEFDKVDDELCFYSFSATL